MEPTMYIGMQGLGVLGAICLLLAYAQISRKVFTASSKKYHGLNLLGATLPVINTAYFEVIGPLILNAIWMVTIQQINSINRVPSE